MKLTVLHEAADRRAPDQSAAKALAWRGKPVPDHSCVYRGISVDEWRHINQTGHIQSDGRHLYPEQHGWTPFGSLDDAIHYGIEVPVWNGDRNAVAYIIEVPRAIVRDRDQHAAVFSGEYAHYGPMPASFIRRVWRAAATGGEVMAPAPNGNLMSHVNCVIEQLT